MRRLVWIVCFIIGITNAFADESETVVVAQPNFTTDKFLGTWYEIARLPINNEENCAKGISIDYGLRKNALQVKLQCVTADMVVVNVEGVAHFVSKVNRSQLKINFSSVWIRWTKYGNMDYWILNTDYNNFAVIGSPDHEHLWIYSRTSKMDVKQLQSLVGFAQNAGYDISNLIYNKSGIE